MPLSFQVLGQPGRDNALFVRIDTGQSVTRLLFDCGRGATLRLVQAGVPIGTISRVFLTHLHSDHVVQLPDLFLTGWAFGRVVEYRPWITGLSMVMLGSVLVTITMALGG